MAFKPNPRQLGEILLASKYINQQQLDEALAIQQKTARRKSLEELLAGIFFKKKKPFPSELPEEALIRNLLYERKFLSRETVEGLIKELIKSHSDRTALIDLIIERKLLGEDELLSLYKIQGGWLCRHNIITPDELLDALRAWKKSKKVTPLGKILIELGHLTETQYVTAMSKYSRIPFVKMDKIKVSSELAKYIPPELVLEYRIIPIQLEQHFLTVAMVFPLDYEGLESMEKTLGIRLNRVLCRDSAFEKMFKEIYGNRMKWY
jgi:hypothetical protein